MPGYVFLSGSPHSQASRVAPGVQGFSQLHLPLALLWLVKLSGFLCCPWRGVKLCIRVRGARCLCGEWCLRKSPLERMGGLCLSAGVGASAGHGISNRSGSAIETETMRSCMTTIIDVCFQDGHMVHPSEMFFSLLTDGVCYSSMSLNSGVCLRFRLGKQWKNAKRKNL